MELNFKQFLPILLVISLPGLGFFLSEENTKNSIPILYQWIYTSSILYVLWQLLAISWRFTIASKQLLFLIVSSTAFLFVASLISYGIGIKSEFSLELKESIRLIFIILIFLTIQYVIKTQEKLETLKVEKEQLSKENYKAQLQSLRNQMDPHFLFNSLNTLRSMVKQNHKSSEEFILNLSNFYRSTLQHNENNTLSLSEELSFLKSYLLLMKSRNETAIKFNITNIDTKYNTFQLPSFALQNVVENCFKHNSMSSKKPLHIEIITTEDNYIQVSNNLQERLTQQPTSGMGLKLLEKRYDLLGVSKGIIVSKRNSNFNVKLKLIGTQ